MASKRKRRGQVEVTSSRRTTADDETHVTTSALTQTRVINVGRQPRGRLGATADFGEVSISDEDLAVLAQHPEFDLPHESLLDFERTVTQDFDPAESQVVEEQAASKKSRVRMLLSIAIVLTDPFCADRS